MTARDDDLRVRIGRIRERSRQTKVKTFTAQVLRAAERAGHAGPSLSRRPGTPSTFGRGRSAALAATLRSPSRRVLVKARVVRHRGGRFRSAPLSAHVAYLKREGVTQDGGRATMFDARSDHADEGAFAERCAGDRHHFRFIVGPEDAPAMADLKAFTRELMGEAERDLGTRLDWVAVEHHNTDNPHVHVLVRGHAQDGSDLVISRDYLARGLRARAEAMVTLELGPRSALEIRSALEREVTAERWTGLDRALAREAEVSGAGLVDLRPGGALDRADPDLRRLLVGRAQHLERFGLAEPLGPAQWSLRPGAETILRDLSVRGDIIRTMHRALSAERLDRGVAEYAIHGDGAGIGSEGIVGRLVARGLHDELAGSAYAIIDGVDGRAHHLRLPDLDATGDVRPGGIVEARLRPRTETRAAGLDLVRRSDLSVPQQVTADGATWLDRQLVSREPTSLARSGFGRQVRDALDARAEHLANQGLARRQGQRMVFARDLLDTLRRRELDAAAGRIAAETGLARHPPAAEGEHVSGLCRRRVNLASGRFAMIDNGLGFQLVPWRPELEHHLGRQVSGVALPGGGVDWSMGKKRGLGL